MHPRTSISSRAIMTAGGTLGIFLLAASALIMPLRAQKAATFGQDPSQDAQNCLSNEKNLGIALVQYTQDYDEVLPNGTQNTSGQPSTGVGWAGQLYSYTRSSYPFHCPTDPTLRQKPHYPISYGLNGNIVGGVVTTLNNPTLTVGLFEAQNDLVLLHQPNEGAAVGAVVFSPAGNGTDGSLRAGIGGSVSQAVLYATGYMGGRVPDNLPGQFTSTAGRHTGGANFTFLDGHASFMQPSDVSAGTNAPDSSAPQTGGATGTAAGTENTSFAATFSLD